MKFKPRPITPNAQDIAAANISLTLVQIVIDTMIEKKLMDSQTMKEICDQMIQSYSAPGVDPARKEIRDATASFANTIRMKYDVPPKAQQN